MHPSGSAPPHIYATSRMHKFSSIHTSPKLLPIVLSIGTFNNDVEKIKFNLLKNAYPPFSIDKVIKNYLDYKFSSNQNQLKEKS